MPEFSTLSDNKKQWCDICGVRPAGSNQQGGVESENEVVQAHPLWILARRRSSTVPHPGMDWDPASDSEGKGCAENQQVQGGGCLWVDPGAGNNPGGQSG